MTVSIERTLERLDALVDGQCGVIGAVQELYLPSVFEHVISGFSAGIGRASDLHPDGVQESDAPVAGYGTALTPELAKVRAMAEALERYCAMMPPRAADILTESPSRLGDDALSINEFPQCSAAERARARPHTRLRSPTRDDPLSWVAGYSLSRDRKVWVPLTAVYLGWPVPLEEHVAFPISTGFAAGPTYAQATLAAVLEVVERDSLALWWLQQLPFPRIPRDLVQQSEARALIDRMDAFGIRTNLFDLTTDTGVPVVGLVQQSERAFPHLVTMASCRPSASAAAVRVLEEAASIHTALITSALARPSFEALLAGDPQPPELFGLYYADEGADRLFPTALLNSPVVGDLTRSLGTHDGLKQVVSRLTALGMEVVVVDVTLEEVRDAGLVVVKVLVPQLMPLTFCHAIRYLDHPRLYDAPARLGFGTRTENDITREPIPYA